MYLDFYTISEESMQSKSKIKGLWIILFAVVFALGAIFLGASRAQTANAAEETAAVETLATEHTVDPPAEGNNGYAVFYFIMDGITATSLMGIAVSEGWEMALWLSFVYWILAVVASIIMVLVTKSFLGKDEEKPYNYAALLGFIWSLFLPVLGFVLSVYGKRLSATHDGGKVFYIGGVIIGGIFMVLSVLLALFHAGAPFLPF